MFLANYVPIVISLYTYSKKEKKNEKKKTNRKEKNTKTPQRKEKLISYTSQSFVIPKSKLRSRTTVFHIPDNKNFYSY